MPERETPCTKGRCSQKRCLLSIIVRTSDRALRLLLLVPWTKQATNDEGSTSRFQGTTNLALPASADIEQAE